MNDSNVLIANLDKLHTTKMGEQRIRKNLDLVVWNVVLWCKNKIEDPNSLIIKKGKNWYVYINNYRITINCYSYTIITLHKLKNQ